MEKEKPARQQDQKSKPSNPAPSGLNSFIRYSGMGFQMVAVILIFYWAGSKLDGRSSLEKPVFTAVFTVLGVFAGIYLALKDFIFRKDD